jgi:diguanylate cyclase (GGDEF)-like protein
MKNDKNDSRWSEISALIEKNDGARLSFDGEPEGGLSYACLLHNFVHLDFTEDEAIFHWKNILENIHGLERATGRPINVYTSVVDYFTNQNPLLTSPLLVEVRVFQQTEQMAMIDALTGLFNRHYMETILKKEYMRCERYSKRFSVCILDIDNFKAVNDTKGHLYGDQVLRNLAAILRTAVREEDIACRYGGEEFLVIIPETDSAGALALGNRIRTCLKEAPFFLENGITFSAGTATYPLDAHDVEALVKAADMALYQAKFSGKDCVVAAGPDRRKCDRVERGLPFSLLGKGTGSPFAENMTHNISLGGIQFESTEKYRINSGLHFQFAAGNAEAQGAEAHGYVTWVRKIHGVYRYGVRFVETPLVLETEISMARKSVISQL